MSLLRILGGSLDSEAAVTTKLRYVMKEPKTVMAYGLPMGDVKSITVAWLLPHIAYGRHGSRLAYHVLLDFGGKLDAEQAGSVAWEVNGFLRERGAQYVQGTHSTKSSGAVMWPHAHILVNTVYMTGKTQGMKLHFDRALLKAYKLYANKVLAAYGLPVITVWGGEHAGN